MSGSFCVPIAGSVLGWTATLILLATLPPAAASESGMREWFHGKPTAQAWAEEWAGVWTLFVDYYGPDPFLIARLDPQADPPRWTIARSQPFLLDPVAQGCRFLALEVDARHARTPADLNAADRPPPIAVELDFMVAERPARFRGRRPTLPNDGSPPVEIGGSLEMNGQFYPARLVRTAEGPLRLGPTDHADFIRIQNLARLSEIEHLIMRANDEEEAAQSRNRIDVLTNDLKNRLGNRIDALLKDLKSRPTRAVNLHTRRILVLLLGWEPNGDPPWTRQRSEVVLEGMFDDQRNESLVYGPEWTLEAGRTLVRALAGQGRFSRIQARWADRLLCDAEAWNPPGWESDTERRAELLALRLHAPFDPEEADRRARLQTELDTLNQRLDRRADEELGRLAQTSPKMPALDVSQPLLVEAHLDADDPGCLALEAALGGLARSEDRERIVILSVYSNTSFMLSGAPRLETPTIDRAEPSRLDDLDQTIPRVTINGVPIPLGGGSMARAAMWLTELRKALRDMKAAITPDDRPIRLQAEAVRNQDRLDIRLQAEVADLRPEDRFYVVVALIESRVAYPGMSGARWHHGLLRALPAGPSGLALQPQPGWTRLDWETTVDLSTLTPSVAAEVPKPAASPALWLLPLGPSPPPIPLVRSLPALNPDELELVVFIEDRGPAARFLKPTNPGVPAPSPRYNDPLHKVVRVLRVKPVSNPNAAPAASGESRDE